ncbi:MAG: hypothetical protein N3D84_03150, partial [Candidatus Woesearchaeota archaeon]|nr:hypothetical protein [Candidatus Woesearchaeota archaeon]
MAIGNWVNDKNTGHIHPYGDRNAEIEEYRKGDVIRQDPTDELEEKIRRALRDPRTKVCNGFPYTG